MGHVLKFLILWISALKVIWCIGLIIGEFLSNLSRSTWLCGFISSMLFWIQFLTSVWLLIACLLCMLGVWVLNVFSQESANASAWRCGSVIMLLFTFRYVPELCGPVPLKCLIFWKKLLGLVFLMGSRCLTLFVQ